MRFSKFLILIVILMSFILVFSVEQKGKFKWEDINSAVPISSDAERDYLQKTPRFSENGCPRDKDQTWVVGKAIGCKLSPNGKFIGKFIFNGLHSPEKYYELVIMNGGGEWTVFTGDYRTLGWEWTKDNRIKILYNCGTGCKAVRVIGLDKTVLFSDYTDGKMDEEHGWKVKFSGL